MVMDRGVGCGEFLLSSLRLNRSIARTRSQERDGCEPKQARACSRITA